MGEVVPGPVVERVDSGEDGVEIHDMNVAAGDRLEACLFSGGLVTAVCRIDIAALSPVKRAARPVSSFASGSPI